MLPPKTEDIGSQQSFGISYTTLRVVKEQQKSRTVTIIYAQAAHKSGKTLTHPKAPSSEVGYHTRHCADLDFLR
jgi:hypothetical protein